MYDKISAYIRNRVVVTDEALERAFGYSRVVNYKKGDVIQRAGEYCHFIGFMNNGLIMVTLNDDSGKEVICNFFFENEFFTHIESINTPIPSHQNFIALEDCTMLQMNKSELPAVFAVDKAFEDLFSKIILEDLQKALRQMQDWQMLSVEERYLNMMRDHGGLINRVPLKYIAGYLGVAPPSLSRLRKRLGKK